MKLVVIGAGGHARSLIEALRADGRIEPVACTDPRPELRGKRLDGVEVVGDDSLLVHLLGQGVGAACVGLGGTGDNEPRSALFERAVELGFAFPAIIHPRATVATTAAIASGTVVLAGAIIGAGAVLGQNVIVNTAAVVEHDCIIEDHVHIATAAALGGRTTVREAAHVGLGASILQGVEVGRRAIVGAGAVVTKDVTPGVVVVGSPARPVEDGA